MLGAMTRRERSICTHSDPVFQIEWYFWELPRETKLTKKQSALINSADEMPAGFALINTSSDTDATLDDNKITEVISTAETPWLDPLL